MSNLALDWKAALIGAGSLLVVLIGALALSSVFGGDDGSAGEAEPSPTVGFAVQAPASATPMTTAVRTEVPSSATPPAAVSPTQPPQPVAAGATLPPQPSPAAPSATIAPVPTQAPAPTATPRPTSTPSNCSITMTIFPSHLAFWEGSGPLALEIGIDGCDWVVDFTLRPSEPWIVLSQAGGTLQPDGSATIGVGVDRDLLNGPDNGEIVVESIIGERAVQVTAE